MLKLHFSQPVPDPSRMEPGSGSPPALPPPDAPAERDPMEYVLIGVGIALGLLGSILINVGNNIQARLTAVGFPRAPSPPLSAGRGVPRGVTS